MAESQRSAGKTGYAVAAGIFLAGVVIAAGLIVYVIVSINNMSNSLERMIIPGTEEINLEETGRYTVFYEEQMPISDRGFDADDDPPDISIDIVDADTGDRVPVSGGLGEVNYDFWSRSGQSIGSFQIDEPGTYEISAEFDNGEEVDEAVLALGEGIGTTIILAIVAGLSSGLFFCASIGVALIVVVITLIRRSRSHSPGTPQTQTG